ncbi:MAG: prephenate dehydrogenase/arogenate dehydrogenase family protein [Rhodopirellula sp.]|nr:prephenate dehydrogenase/arogenate dehydrogenase family protein [Rhodopirellula sp.]
MRRYDTVAIVGVGLIGGSIGLALRERGLAKTVIGIGRRQSSLRAARRVGAVTNTTIDLAKGVADAELIVIATPVARIVEHALQSAQTCPEGALITDAGSTKEAIVEQLDGRLPRNCRYLGSHPLAGSEKAGASHATADLFEGRVAILTPTVNTHAEDFDQLEQFWSDLGSVVIQMGPADHDRAMAVTSHLPHAVASVLASMLPESLFRLTGAGFHDTTRVACGDAELWKQIFAANRANLLACLDQFSHRLHALRSSLEQNDAAAVEDILRLAKKNRDALGS